MSRRETQRQRLRPLHLVTALHRPISDPIIPTHRNSNITSIDLDATRQDILALPSPYHDEHRTSSPPLPHATPRPSFLSAFFSRFKYHPLDAEEKEGAEADAHSSHSSTSSLPHHCAWSNHVVERAPQDEGHCTALLFSALLLSLLFNFFLVFNGPLVCLGGEKRISVLGGNSGVGEMGGSGGVVYTDDGKRVRFGMFGELACLGVLSGEDKEGGEKRKECLEYLRERVECWADDGLEVGRIVGGGWVFGGGVGEGSECRNETREWLYEVTACGEGGCKGKAFYHSEEEMRGFREKEEEELKKWKTEHRHDGHGT
ncbi:hypothetical protein EJ04DRAFT_563092 [Polyplosphaeria fusca]|uniref:Uncharacterized protein n=1 Tax=Polyplosphaeria fusca TaxID=682080 RepID=A0A9P4QXJ4_9PLEO|nr:hypothetical protein EJ04DRAFT_563092 [Polyplosphaeria fusca]